MGVYVGQVVKAERSEFFLQLCDRCFLCVEGGKSSPFFVSLVLCRYSTCGHSNGLLVALSEQLQEVF